MLNITIFFLVLGLVISHSNEPSEIETIVIEFLEPLQDWVGFNKSGLEIAQECELEKLESDLLNFHKELAETGEDFTRQHIDVIRKVFKSNHEIKNFFKCIVDKRNTENEFFKEQRKYKFLDQFIKEYAFIANEMFYISDKPIDKGYRLGRFFQAFFEFYYQHILYPADTASTKLIRAMTPNTNLFNHEDISICLSLETSGKLSESLENLGIYNIYINVPEAFNALKYLKFKDNCKGNDKKYKELQKEIHERLGKIDMFKIMYHESNPWVEVAAEKYGNKQIEYIARVFCKIANNFEHYIKISQLSEEEL